MLGTGCSPTDIMIVFEHYVSPFSQHLNSLQVSQRFLPLLRKKASHICVFRFLLLLLLFLFILFNGAVTAFFVVYCFLRVNDVRSAIKVVHINLNVTRLFLRSFLPYFCQPCKKDSCVFFSKRVQWLDPLHRGCLSMN